MQKIGIFYGSTGGNTENAARQIQQELGADNAQLFDVSNAKIADIEQFTNIILGTSTWGIGDLQDDFEGFLPDLKSADLTGKTVAIFGCGDQDSYADSFVDGMGEIWEVVSEKGCNVIGQTNTSGYSHTESRAEMGGEFVGLALDEDNQPNLTAERIKEWVQNIKPLFQ